MKTILPLFVLAPLVACTVEAAPEVQDQAALALGIRNAVQVEPGLISSGQPTEEQLAALPELGYRVVIQLRPSDEEGAGWEEAKAEQLGVRFLRIPVAGAAGLTEENARALDAALKEAGDDGVVVACASGNRVGGLLALRAHLCGGATAEEALAIGKRSGLTRGEPAVREVLGLPEAP